MNQLTKLELMTLEITKAIIINVGPNWYDHIELVDRAENIALALLNRFQENSPEE